MVACLRRKSCTPFAAYAFIYLVGQGLALCLLLSTELNMLGSLHNLLMLRLADTAFHLDDKFLRYFCLSPQDGLGLPMVPTLLPLVSACTLSTSCTGKPCARCACHTSCNKYCAYLVCLPSINFTTYHLWAKIFIQR